MPANGAAVWRPSLSPPAPPALQGSLPRLRQNSNLQNARGGSGHVMLYSRLKFEGEQVRRLATGRSVGN